MTTKGYKYRTIKEPAVNVFEKRRAKVVEYLKEKYRLDWPGVDAHVAIPFPDVAREIRKIERILLGE